MYEGHREAREQHARAQSTRAMEWCPEARQAAARRKGRWEHPCVLEEDTPSPAACQPLWAVDHARQSSGSSLELFVLTTGIEQSQMTPDGTTRLRTTSTQSPVSCPHVGSGRPLARRDTGRTCHQDDCHLPSPTIASVQLSRGLSRVSRAALSRGRFVALRAHL